MNLSLLLVSASALLFTSLLYASDQTQPEGGELNRVPGEIHQIINQNMTNSESDTMHSGEKSLLTKQLFTHEKNSLNCKNSMST